MAASIITPTLDAIGWVEDCITNVAEQGDSVAEHIIVDGGSSDGTIEKIEVLAKCFPGLILIVEPHCNQSAALNRGTDAATTDIIGILNVDDAYEPDAVRRGVTFLERTEPPAFVAGNCRIFGTNRRFVWNRPDDLRLESLLLGWDVCQYPCNPSAYFYDRKVHDIVGGYDIEDDYSMDVDFIFKCAAQVKMHYVAEHWGNFRWGPGGKSFEDRAGPLRRRRMIDRHIARLGPEQRAAMHRIGLRRRGTKRPIVNHFDVRIPWPISRESERGCTLAKHDEHVRFSLRADSLVPLRFGPR